jgi:hypothetical protein
MNQPGGMVSEEAMTTPNAFGFFLLGLAMLALPAVCPDYFPSTSIDGSNTSALWLFFMGPVHAWLGLWWIARNEIAPLWQLAIDWQPASVAGTLRDEPLLDLTPA